MRVKLRGGVEVVNSPMNLSVLEKSDNTSGSSPKSSPKLKVMLMDDVADNDTKQLHRRLSAQRLVSQGTTDANESRKERKMKINVKGSDEKK